LNLPNIDYKNNNYNKYYYVQNSAVRLLTSTRRHEHITPPWTHHPAMNTSPRHERITPLWTHHPCPTQPSPAPDQIQDRLLNITHHPQSRKQPGPSLPFRPPPPPRPCSLPQVRRCKHAEDHQAQVPFLGGQGLLSCCTLLWNALPVHIRQAPTLSSFKQALKTHLLKLAFTCWPLHPTRLTPATSPPLHDWPLHSTLHYKTNTEPCMCLPCYTWWPHALFGGCNSGFKDHVLSLCNTGMHK